MAQAAKQQVQTKPKRISAKQIVVLDKAQFREEVSQDRIEWFKELYKSKAEVPAIEVQLLQGGSPDAHKYVIREGVHRFRAMEALKYKEVKAIVFTDLDVTVNDIDSIELENHILYNAVISNDNSPWPPTMGERRKAVEKLILHDWATKDLKPLAPIATIKRWKAEMRKEGRLITNRQKQQSQAKAENKQECYKLFEERKGLSDKEREKEGLTNVAIAKKLGLGETTVRRYEGEWKEEQASKKKGSPGGSNEPGGDPQQEDAGTVEGIDRKGKTTPSPGDEEKGNLYDFNSIKPTPDPTEEEINENIRTVKTATDTFCKVLKTAEWSPELDEYILNKLVPVLSLCSKALNDALGGGKYAQHVTRVAYQIEDYKKDLASSNKRVHELEHKLAKRDALIEKLREEGVENTPFALDLARKEALDTIDGLIGHLKRETDMISSVDEGEEQHLIKAAIDTAYMLVSAFETACARNYIEPRIVTLFNRYVKIFNADIHGYLRQPMLKARIEKAKKELEKFMIPNKKVAAVAKRRAS